MSLFRLGSGPRGPGPLPRGSWLGGTRRGCRQMLRSPLVLQVLPGSKSGPPQSAHLHSNTRLVSATPALLSLPVTPSPLTFLAVAASRFGVVNDARSARFPGDGVGTGHGRRLVPPGLGFSESAQPKDNPSESESSWVPPHAGSPAVPLPVGLGRIKSRSRLALQMAPPGSLPPRPSLFGPPRAFLASRSDPPPGPWTLSESLVARLDTASESG